ncbi:rRNA methyltransferase [Lampropedia cohaerens]|uniref:rRNA methyltransferase n=1 Tax=Lampropedia cohaerens TaxID=1610491 RepID=A0A0U1PWV1_9BURK|nr:RNA methyltransferase [Lampropedia cohaerens]KKW67023.1 rRNA methyltransferase [Lampropedia cohaerens]
MFHTRFVLVQTSHAGNVGAIARAMRTMGFVDLVLVAPRWPDVLQHQEAIDRASGAHDVLERARVVQTLDAALDGIHHVCATAMVPRDFGPPTRSPREHLQALPATLAARAAPGQVPGVAFVFGSERFGMRNEDVYRCDVALRIPTDAQFGSLNIAAAVQVIAYEWRLSLQAAAMLADAAPAPADTGGAQRAGAEALADAATLAGMLAHWQEGLQALGYLDPKAPRKLMPRLRQLFLRAQPTEQEIHILRGIAKAMLEVAGKSAAR